MLKKITITILIYEKSLQLHNLSHFTYEEFLEFFYSFILL